MLTNDYTGKIQSMNPLRPLVRRFDRWLNRQLRVRVFTDDPQKQPPEGFEPSGGLL